MANAAHSGSWYKRLWKEMRNSDPLNCGLCGQVIDKSLRFPDRWAFTLDMKIPYSRGGAQFARDPNAWQPAHAHCNFSKRDNRRRKNAMHITDEDEP
jgi:hypothetical protein